MCDSPSSRDRALTILVVDNDHNAADSLTDLLALYGHRAHAAYSGMTAMELASECSPDIVLVDLTLPRLNGFIVALWLRSQAPSVRLVALTVEPDAEVTSRCEAAGFHTILRKPLDMEVLDDVLRQAVEWRTCACGVLSAT